MWGALVAALLMAGSGWAGEYRSSGISASASQCLRTDSTGSHFLAGPGCGSVETVVNDASGDVDFRVESNDLTHALFLDAGNNRLGVGISTPAASLDVSGNAQFGSGSTKSTFSAAGALTLASGGAMTAAGGAGYIIGSSSITTTGGGFFNTLTASTGTSGNVLFYGASGVLNQNSELFWNNTLSNLGIRTNAPQMSLDVNGGSQFGSGATKSTMTGGGEFLAAATITGRDALVIVGSVTGQGRWEFQGQGRVTGAATYTSSGTYAATPLLISSAALSASGTNAYIYTNSSATANSVRVAENAIIGPGDNNSSANLNVEGTAKFGGGASKSTFSATGDLTLASGGDLTVSGASGFIASASSVNVSGVFANGFTAAGPGGNFVGVASVTASGIFGVITPTAGTAISLSGAGGNLISASSITTTGGVFSNTLTASTGTAGNVLHYGASGLVNQSSSLYWDDANRRLGVGTRRPEAGVHVSSRSLYVDGNAYPHLHLGNTNIGGGLGMVLGIEDTRATEAIAYFRNVHTEAVVTLLHGSDAPTKGLKIDNGGSFTATDAVLNLNRSGAAIAWVGSDGNMGLGTTAPATTLEVNGAAQFGSDATKSTFTAAGNLQAASGFTLLNSSLTVRNNTLDAAAVVISTTAKFRAPAMNGVFNGIVSGENMLIQYGSATVNGSLAITFTGIGLKAYSLTPLVITTPLFNSAAGNILHCPYHTASAAGFTIECSIGSGDGVSATHAADASDRQVNWMAIGPAP